MRRKLSKKEKRRIRELYATGYWYYRTLAKKFDVAERYIDLLVRPKKPWTNS